MIMLGMEYLIVSKIYGLLMIVQGVKGVVYGEVVEIEIESGEKRKGQVFEVREDMVIVQVFEGIRDFDIKIIRVCFIGEIFKVLVLMDMFGRIFNGIGKLIDGGLEIILEDRCDVYGVLFNLVVCVYLRDFIQIGILVIDV